MIDEASSGSSGHPHWDAFSRRHAGNPFLELDSLYALSEPLIDSIKHRIPRFFTPDQERFERDLVRAASFGFFLRRPLGICAKTLEEESERALDERQEQTFRQIDEMMAEQLRRSGADNEDVEAYFEQETADWEKIASRQEAYAGWLILNPDFRGDVDYFRDRWGATVRDLGRFPRLPMQWVIDPYDDASLPSDFRDECYNFFCQWGLETMATWDWPVPMEPDLATKLRDVDLLSSGGMCLFVPWYLLRGDKLDLRGVVQRSRLLSAPNHLRGWVNKREKRKGDGMGDVRYATIRWLYRYDELVLSRRYSTACAGKRQRLDQAFADVLARNEDTVKKLRRELRQGLENGAADHPPA